MKTKERNQRLRKSKTSIDKLALALDAIPEGKHLDALAKAILARQILNDLNANIKLPPRAAFDGVSLNRRANNAEVFDWKLHARNDLLAFGLLLAAAAEKGDAQLFRDMASTIENWSGHKPVADERLASFFQTVRKVQSEAKIVSTRDVIYGFKRDGVLATVPRGDDYINLARTVRRWGQDFGITIKGESGKPKAAK